MSNNQIHQIQIQIVENNHPFNEKITNLPVKPNQLSRGLRQAKSLLNEKLKALNDLRSPIKNTHKLRANLFKSQNKGLGAQIFSPNNRHFKKYSSNNLKALCKNKIQTKSNQKQDFDCQIQENLLKKGKYKQNAEQNINAKGNEKNEQNLIEENKKQHFQIKRMRNKVKIIEKNDFSQNRFKLSPNKLEKISISNDDNAKLFEHQKESQLQTSYDDYNSSEISRENSQLNNLNLEIESRVKSKMTTSMLPEYFPAWNTSKLSTVQKIQNHLNILEKMSLFVDQSRNIYDISEQWLQLDFLIYKKYYLERFKVLNFLKKYPMKNPFIIQNVQISSKEIIQFMKTDEGNKFKTELQIENKMIKQKLLCYYSKFSKVKVGEKINLHEHDNFSHWIIEELWAQFVLTEYSTHYSYQKINIRLCKIMQIIFLVSELNGKPTLSFQEGQYALKNNHEQEYIQESKLVFQKQLLYKQY